MWTAAIGPAFVRDGRRDDNLADQAFFQRAGIAIEPCLRHAFHDHLRVDDGLRSLRLSVRAVHDGAGRFFVKVRQAGPAAGRRKSRDAPAYERCKEGLPLALQAQRIDDREAVKQTEVDAFLRGLSQRGQHRRGPLDDRVHPQVVERAVEQGFARQKTGVVGRLFQVTDAQQRLGDALGGTLVDPRRLRDFAQRQRASFLAENLKNLEGTRDRAEEQPLVHTFSVISCRHAHSLILCAHS